MADGRVHRLRPLEKDAQATIVDLAGWRRWWPYHTFDSRHSQGGFPDLVLVRERVIFAEVKRTGEKPRRDQREVLDKLARAGCEVYVWTLDDLSEIGRILDRRWEFVPFGSSVILGAVLDGVRLVDRDAHVSMAPRSAWIPGHGRRDANAG